MRLEMRQDLHQSYPEVQTCQLVGLVTREVLCCVVWYQCIFRLTDWPVLTVSEEGKAGAEE